MSVELKNMNGKVITFYSYKGGVGRTMSLVNIACLFAKRNKKVLLIDWDLEAPGLHNFFNREDDNEQLGLVDFITDGIEFHKKNEEADENEISTFISNHIEQYITNKVIDQSNGLNIDIIKAGKFDDEYAKRLNEIKWLDFYKDSPFFFTQFATVLESKYDYIFIDSRTGLSDSGGICTMLMPQILVTVFALNNQNINGVIDIAKQAIEYRFESNDLRNFNVLPLPSRIDNQNAKELQEWILKYSSIFETIFKEAYLLDECSLLNYFNKAKIPYKPEHAYGEKIPALTESIENDFFIAFHYNEFCNLISDNQPAWEVLSATQIEQNRIKAQEHLKKGLELYYQKNYEASIQEFEQVVTLLPLDTAAYINFGLSLSNLAGMKEGQEAEALYHQAFEKYQIAIDLKPDYHQAFNNWGNAIGKFALTKKGQEAEVLYHQAFEKYQKAIEINPEFHEPYYNWGNAIGNLAKTKEGQEAEALYQQALEKSQKAIDLKPDDHEAFNNLGCTIGNLALIKKGQEAEALFLQSFEKYEKATELKPDYHMAFNNWGIDLGNLAKAKEGKEAEALYQHSFEKYAKAIELKPDDHVAFNNWGNNLINLAKTKVGTEAEALIQLAVEKGKSCYDLSGLCYNYACALALLGKKNEAFHYLDICLTKNQESIDTVKKDDDWKQYLEDEEFKSLIQKHQSNENLHQE